MADLSNHPPERDPSETDPFRERALFQHSLEPLFLLNQQRRVLSVNRAWEELTGVLGSALRGLVCRRRTLPEATAAEALAGALCPPAEVLAGVPGRVRRRVRVGQGYRWWDIDYFPLHDRAGRIRILGRITSTGTSDATGPSPLPEKLTALGEKLQQRQALSRLASSVPAMRRVVEQVKLASQSRAPVLLVGEPGSGKEWLARTIHEEGPLRQRHFAAVDCGRLPPPALANVLFADGGLLHMPGLATLYLKDIVALPRDLQARLCDSLTEMNVAGPRLLAGSASNLAGEVKAHRLLDALQLALSTLVIAVPSLRERRDDLPWLVERLLERAGEGDDKQVVGLTSAAWDLVREHTWPGNVRELYAVLSQARARAAGTHIDAVDLPAYLRLVLAVEQQRVSIQGRTLALDPLLEQVERRLLVLALRRAQGNKSRAAELLAIWRPRLLRRLEALGIEKSKGLSQDL